MSFPWTIASGGFGALSGLLLGGNRGAVVGAFIGVGLGLLLGPDDSTEEAGDEMAGPIGMGRGSDQAMLGSLEPVSRGLFSAFLIAAHAAGHNVYIRSAARSYAEQKQLWDEYVARGMTGLPASNPDTNPSSHIFRAGCDIGYLDDHGEPIKSSNVPDSRWEQLAEIGRQSGLKPGLDFSHPDKVHFERPDWRALKAAA